MSLFRLAAAVVVVPTLVSAWGASASAAEPAKTKTKNVILMMSDGIRWEEIFRGAQPELISEKPGGVENVEELKKLFGQETAEERRKALFPFLTEVVAKQGQLYGNEGEESVVTNGKHFSYPGYNETFTGFGDPRIDSNDKVNNPNVTVFEWLNNQDAYRGKVAGFGSWDCFPFILNSERSGIDVVAGQRDQATFEKALEKLKNDKPRVLFIGLGGTDGAAHNGRFDNYLKAAHYYDQSVQKLWETVQSLPEYKDQTTLILTTDHGRGGLPDGWRHHSAKIPGSDRIWIGVLGPDTPARGDSPLPKTTQSQVAATIAALLGEDYNAEQPKAGPAIERALPQAETAAGR